MLSKKEEMAHKERVQEKRYITVFIDNKKKTKREKQHTCQEYMFVQKVSVFLRRKLINSTRLCLLCLKHIYLIIKKQF